MNIIVLDTETTGLRAQQGRADAIIQVAAVAVKDGEIVDTFESLCFPGEEYFENGRADDALRVNKHTLEELRAAPSHDLVANDLDAWIVKHRPAVYTAYNVGFDRPFLEAHPWFIDLIEDTRWGRCIMLHAARYLGEQGKNSRRYNDWRWVKLQEAVRLLDLDLQEELQNAHDALADTVMAARVMLVTGMEVGR